MGWVTSEANSRLSPRSTFILAKRGVHESEMQIPPHSHNLEEIEAIIKAVPCFASQHQQWPTVRLLKEHTDYR